MLNGDAFHDKIDKLMKKIRLEEVQDLKETLSESNNDIKQTK